MSDFLEAWDWALSVARRRGEAMHMAKLTPDWWDAICVADSQVDQQPEEVRACVTARTMHPSFMGGPVPKWDPKRDQFSRMLRQAA